MHHKMDNDESFLDLEKSSFTEWMSSILAILYITLYHIDDVFVIENFLNVESVALLEQYKSMDSSTQLVSRKFFLIQSYNVLTLYLEAIDVFEEKLLQETCNSLFMDATNATLLSKLYYEYAKALSCLNRETDQTKMKWFLNDIRNKKFESEIENENFNVIKEKILWLDDDDDHKINKEQIEKLSLEHPSFVLNYADNCLVNGIECDNANNIVHRVLSHHSTNPLILLKSYEVCDLQELKYFAH